MTKFFVLLLASLWATTASAVDHSDRKITAAQARALVLASLIPKQRQLPSLGADPYKDPSNSKLLFFTVTWAGTPNGSVVVGSYAVVTQTPKTKPL